jgi:hypothetical protein
MKSPVFDFKAINRRLNRQDQKAEFEAKNPKVDQAVQSYLYGVAVPFGRYAGEHNSVPVFEVKDLSKFKI